MEYINSLLKGLVNCDETYAEKAERLRCERCHKFPDNTCFCIQCMSNELILEAYYNAVKYDKDANSAQILCMILPSKIKSSVNETEKTELYNKMLHEANEFIHNNPQNADNV